MYIEFEEEYLRELFEFGRTSDKRHRYRPEIVRGYVKCVNHLLRANNIEDLYPIHSLNYEVLRGDKLGRSSVRINNKYRLEFKIREFECEEILSVCSLLEISNHYR